jgi:hypothetical protein
MRIYSDHRANSGCVSFVDLFWLDDGLTGVIPGSPACSTLSRTPFQGDQPFSRVISTLAAPRKPSPGTQIFGYATYQMG